MKKITIQSANSSKPAFPKSQKSVSKPHPEGKKRHIKRGSYKLPSKSASSENMRHGGRWEHLQNLWNGWVRGDSQLLPQLDRYLAAQLRKNKKFGSQDRRWYSEWIFAALRYWSLCLPAYGLNQSEKKSFREQLRLVPTQKVFSATRQCMAHFTPDNPALAKVPEEMAFNSGQLVDTLKTFDSQDVNSLFQSILGLDTFFQQEFQKRCELAGWDTEKTRWFLLQQLSKSPFWVRLNHPDRKEEVLRELTEAGYQVTQHEEALCATGQQAIYGLNCWNKGFIEIQDAASQQLSEVLQAKPGQIVWDACAGGGGKTLAIASKLRNKGAIYASDIREYKLLETKRRAKKASFDNVRTFLWDGSKPPKLSLEVHRRGGFDAAFVDAPCSSLGTLRRNPDAKVRLSQEEVLKLTKLQLQLLTQASCVVKSGGTLVYATCSWLPAENEEVVHAFLESDEGKAFTLEQQHIFGCPEIDADTMFAARLVRRQT